MYKFATAIGLDIGRTMIRSAIVRYDGKIFESFNFPFEEHPGRELLLKYIIEAVKETRKRSKVHKVNPLCVGIAAKGFIDINRGVVIGPDQGIDGWTDVPLSAIVFREVGLPVFLDNDANLMALAETSYGSATGNRNMVFVALRSGIGGAVFIDGKLYRGLNNAAGEIGQMSVNIEGPLSKTGIKGSFEYYASSVALVRSYRVFSGQAENEGRTGIKGLKAKDIFDLSYRNDENAIKAVKQNAEYVGAGIANLISIFSPEIIVLGGGLSMAKDAYIEMIRKSAIQNSLEYCSKYVKIERASLGYSASLLGSSLYALTRLDGKTI